MTPPPSSPPPVDLMSLAKSVASKNVSLYIATPCYGCCMRTEFMVSILKLQALCIQSKIAMSFDALGNDSLVQRARNILVSRFLKSGCTHLLFIDADIAFEPAAVLRLILHDKDITSAVYPKKSINWDAIKQKRASGDSTEDVRAEGLDYNINIKQGERIEVENGFVKVLDTATGFMLCKRSALEKLAKEFKDELYCVNDIPGSRDTVPEYIALFDCMVCPETKRYLSEDYSLCRRAQSIGLDIWADLATPLAHIGTQTMHGDVMQRFSLSYAG